MGKSERNIYLEARFQRSRTVMRLSVLVPAVLSMSCLTACENSSPAPKSAETPVSEAAAQSGPSADANWVRDPNIAVQEEFELAEKDGTKAAYEMFITRHPDHALADAARRRVKALETQSTE